MKYTAGTISSVTGVSLHTYSWAPHEIPQGQLFIVHGLSEHTTRHSHLARFFNDHGWNCYGYDIPGHGRSDGRKIYIKSMDDLASDLVRFIDEIGLPDTPIAIYGQSLGALLAIKAALSSQVPIADAFALTAPALSISIAPFLHPFSKFIARLLPSFPTVTLNPEHLSSDPETVENYRSDPYVFHGRIPAITAHQIIYHVKEVQRKANQFTSPLLIIHGLDDKIIDPAGSEHFYKNIDSKIKELILLDNAKHEPLKEPDHKIRLMKTIFAFIDDVLKRGQDRRPTQNRSNS